MEIKAASWIRGDDGSWQLLERLCILKLVPYLSPRDQSQKSPSTKDGGVIPSTMYNCRFRVKTKLRIYNPIDENREPGPSVTP